MPSPMDRLKILINSSTPIVVMETVEEMRALGLVRGACSDLNLALFEWTIADGLVRSDGAVAVAQAALGERIRFAHFDVQHARSRASSSEPRGHVAGGCLRTERFSSAYG